jgi:glucose 1-dehydrogenase
MANSKQASAHTSPDEAQQLRIAGQVAIVTGASSGIGRAVAKALALAGAIVVVNHRPAEGSKAKADAVVAEIAAVGGKARACAADVSKAEQVEAMVADTVDRFGALDIMAANAGIERSAPIQNMSLADWREVIDVNLTGAFLCARAAARQFLERGPRPGISPAAGKIVVTSSVHEFIPWAFQANYAASKGGIMLLMKSLAQELAPKKIRVNSVAPGAIATAINADSRETPRELESLLELIPYGRVGDPEDIARAVAWLVSDAADYVNGTSLVIDGGMSLYPGFRGGG